MGTASSVCDQCIGVGTGGALGACAPPTFTCLPRPHNNFARVTQDASCSSDGRGSANQEIKAK